MGDVSFKFTTKEFQESQKAYISIDEQDLVTQVGGILGITIGWSFDSFLSLIPSILTGMAKTVHFF
jgi:hypothetical protein